MGEEGDGNQSHPMQGLLVNASEGAGRVDFPCYYLVGALFSSMGKGLKGRVTLRAELLCVVYNTWNSSGVTLQITLLVGKFICWRQRGTRSVSVPGVCAGMQGQLCTL